MERADATTGSTPQLHECQCVAELLAPPLTPEMVLEAYVRGADGPRPLSLADYRGQWVVLFFYPRDFTFVCPTEIQGLARLHPDFASEGAVVIGASTDSYYAHRAWY